MPAAPANRSLIKTVADAFCARFAPGAHVLRDGRRGSRSDHGALRDLGVAIDESANLPDVIVQGGARLVEYQSLSIWLVFGLVALPIHNSIVPQRQIGGRPISHKMAAVAIITPSAATSGCQRIAALLPRGRGRRLIGQTSEAMG